VVVSSLIGAPVPRTTSVAKRLNPERDRLHRNLEHAEAARSAAGGVDLSTEDAAIASLDARRSGRSSSTLMRSWIPIKSIS